MYYKKLCRKDKKYMSENGQLTAKKPLNNNVSNGNINFNGIIAGAKRIEEEQNEKFKNDMQEMARKERERADKIESLLLKAHEKTEEERKRKMEEEQKAAEEKAREEVRETYRKEDQQIWNENKNDKAFRNLLKDLNK